MTDIRKQTRTKPIEGEPDGKNDLRVIFDSEGKHILRDGRLKNNSEK